MGSSTLWLALSFLTTLPISTIAMVSDEEMTRTVTLFPMVGLLIGALNTGVFYLGLRFWSPQVAAWMYLTANALITGGLHLDGWIDTFDALGSRKSRSDMLNIMKDSRIGAIGAVALMCLVGLKASLLTLGANHLRVLIAAPLAGRLAMAITTQSFPYGRERGLGKAINAKLTFGGWLSLHLLSLTPLYLLLGFNAFLYLAVALAFGLLWARNLAYKFGGLTGDCYGAVNELVELLFLGLCVIKL